MEKTKKSLNFRQQIPASRERDPQSILIIGVNDTEFMRLLDMALPNDDGTSIFVLTEEEQLYLSRMKESAPSNSELQDLLTRNPNESEKVDEDGYVGWEMPSAHHAFYYVVLSNKEVLVSPYQIDSTFIDNGNYFVYRNWACNFAISRPETA